jgi:hypothetical protein
MSSPSSSPAASLAARLSQEADKSHGGGGGLLRSKRAALGLSLEDVTGYTKIPGSSLSHYERGNKLPSMRHARILAWFYGTTIDALFPWTEADVQHDMGLPGSRVHPKQ